MPYANPLRETVIKANKGDSSKLNKDEKVVVRKGGKIGFTDLDFDVNDHAGVDIAGDLGPFKTGDRVYIYTPHWKLPEALTKRELNLPAPHFDQVDNETGYHGSGHRQCSLTSHAMLLDHLFKGDLTKQARSNGHSEAEGFYGKLLYPYGDTTNHTAHTRLLREKFGIESYWSTTLSPRDLRRSLEVGIPIVTGHIYKSSGHITLTVADLGDRGWGVNDPYGARAGTANYYITIGNHSGDHDIYSNACLEKIFWEQKVTKDPETGWGRIITSINGKSTGLPNGL